MRLSQASCSTTHQLPLCQYSQHTQKSQTDSCSTTDSSTSRAHCRCRHSLSLSCRILLSLGAQVLGQLLLCALLPHHSLLGWPAAAWLPHLWSVRGQHVCLVTALSLRAAITICEHLSTGAELMRAGTGSPLAAPDAVGSILMATTLEAIFTQLICCCYCDYLGLHLLCQTVCVVGLCMAAKQCQ